jgi:hypothetical protein
MSGPRPGASILYMILFLWRFPYFMAIAWTRRESRETLYLVEETPGYNPLGSSLKGCRHHILFYFWNG